jgi:HlyD family secretion protein
MKKKIISILTVAIVLNGCAKKNNTDQVKVAQLLQISTAEVVAIGRVEPEAKITAIGCQVGGILKHLYVHEGDSVKKGALMLELNHDYEDIQLQQALTKTATQTAEIENVKAQLASVKLKKSNLQIKLQRVKNLVARDAETQQNQDNAQTDFDQSLTDIERFTAAYNSEKAKLNERIADVSVVRAAIAQKKIMAPADGIVLNMDVTEGASVTTSKGLFDFAPNSPLTVLCEVDELLAGELKLGQDAYIRNQGAVEKLATGTVIFVSPYLKKKSLFSDDGGNMEDRRVREVRILLRGQPNLLFNTRVEAVIHIH